MLHYLDNFERNDKSLGTSERRLLTAFRFVTFLIRVINKNVSKFDLPPKLFSAFRVLNNLRPDSNVYTTKL